MPDDEFLFVRADRLVNKYAKSIWGGLFFIIVGLGMFIALILRLAHLGVYEHQQSYSQLFPLIMLIVPGYGLTLFKSGITEKKLYYKAAMSGLLLDERGISGPLALLEGPTRDVLRQDKEQIFSIRWDVINTFIVEPVRGRGMSKSPPYYKVTLKGQKGGIADSFFILRSYFAGQEGRIIAYVERYLSPEHIILNDKLTEEESE